MIKKLHIISHNQVSFKNRQQAGRLLGEELKRLRLKADVVLGIPRGGIIVAQEVAQTLNADLDIVLAHKLGAPGNPELAIGSVSEDGRLFLNELLASHVGAGDVYIQQEKARQLIEIKRRIETYRVIRPKVSLKDKTVIVTDDGVATGATIEAVLWSIRQEQPEKLIVALPVGPPDTIEKLAEETDELICLATPPFFSAVGQFYVQFPQVSDEEVLEILKKVKY